MTLALRERVAKALGWTVDDTKRFSVAMLREMVRGKGWKMEYELTRLIQSGGHVYEEV